MSMPTTTGEDSDVELVNGKVRGLMVEADAGHKVRVYQGIRYGMLQNHTFLLPNFWFFRSSKKILKSNP